MIKSITSLISEISEIHNFTDRFDVCVVMCVLKYLEYRVRCRESMKNQKWAIKKIPSQCSAIFCDPPPVLFWFESCSLYVLFIDGPRTCPNDGHLACQKYSFSSRQTNFRDGNQPELSVANSETRKGRFSHTFYIAQIDNADTMCKIQKYLCNKRGGTPLEMFSMVPAPAPEPLNSQ